MNPQDVSQLVAHKFQQLKQPLIDDLSTNMQDIHMGRNAGDSIPMDHECQTSDTNMDGPEWSLYLMGTKHTPASQAGLALSDLFGSPPALTLVHQTKTKLPMYEGVPSTPIAKQQQFKDKLLAVVQQKLESTMHLMVNAVEHPAQQVEYLHTAAAFVRSAVKDIHQQRRSALAGARRHKLDVQPNDDSARLFSKEEDKLLALQYSNQGQKFKKRFPRQHQRQGQQGQCTFYQKQLEDLLGTPIALALREGAPFDLGTN